MSVLGLQSGLCASAPLLISSDFRNKLWVGVGTGLSLYFWTVMLIQDQQNMLIQEHVLLGKITATEIKSFSYADLLFNTYLLFSYWPQTLKQ